MDENRRMMAVIGTTSINWKEDIIPKFLVLGFLAKELEFEIKGSLKKNKEETIVYFSEKILKELYASSFSSKILAKQLCDFDERVVFDKEFLKIKLKPSEGLLVVHTLLTATFKRLGREKIKQQKKAREEKEGKIFGSKKAISDFIIGYYSKIFEVDFYELISIKKKKKSEGEYKFYVYYSKGEYFITIFLKKKNRDKITEAVSHSTTIKDLIFSTLKHSISEIEFK